MSELKSGPITGAALQSFCVLYVSWGVKEELVYPQEDKHEIPLTLTAYPA